MSPSDNVRSHQESKSDQANGTAGSDSGTSSPALKRVKVTTEKGDRPPRWVERINEVLEDEKNKEVLDTKNIVIATIKDGQPYARYHVFRGFVPSPESDQDSELLLTTTDALMPKVDQIEASATSSGGAPSEVVFWTSPTGDQIRLRGLIYLYLPPTSERTSQAIESRFPEFDFESIRQSQWKKMSSHLRASFLRPKPGSVWPEGKKYEFQERLEVGGEGEEEALKRFSLVVFEPTTVDHSEQNAKPPQRFTWTKQADGSWDETRVAP